MKKIVLKNFTDNENELNVNNVPSTVNKNSNGNGIDSNILNTNESVGSKNKNMSSNTTKKRPYRRSSTSKATNSSQKKPNVQRRPSYPIPSNQPDYTSYMPYSWNHHSNILNSQVPPSNVLNTPHQFQYPTHVFNTQSYENELNNYIENVTKKNQNAIHNNLLPQRTLETVSNNMRNTYFNPQYHAPPESRYAEPRSNNGELTQSGLYTRTSNINLPNDHSRNALYSHNIFPAPVTNNINSTSYNVPSEQLNTPKVSRVDPRLACNKHLTNMSNHLQTTPSNHITSNQNVILSSNYQHSMYQNTSRNNQDNQSVSKSVASFQNFPHENPSVHDNYSSRFVSPLDSRNALPNYNFGTRGPTNINLQQNLFESQTSQRPPASYNNNSRFVPLNCEKLPDNLPNRVAQNYPLSTDQSFQVLNSMLDNQVVNPNSSYMNYHYYAIPNNPNLTNSSFWHAENNPVEEMPIDYSKRNIPTSERAPTVSIPLNLPFVAGMSKSIYSHSSVNSAPVLPANVKNDASRYLNSDDSRIYSRRNSVNLNIPESSLIKHAQQEVRTEPKSSERGENKLRNYRHEFHKKPLTCATEISLTKNVTDPLQTNPLQTNPLQINPLQTKQIDEGNHKEIRAQMQKQNKNVLLVNSTRDSPDKVPTNQTKGTIEVNEKVKPAAFSLIMPTSIPITNLHKNEATTPVHTRTRRIKHTPKREASLRDLLLNSNPKIESEEKKYKEAYHKLKINKVLKNAPENKNKKKNVKVDSPASAIQHNLQNSLKPNTNSDNNCDNEPVDIFKPTEAIAKNNLLPEKNSKFPVLHIPNLKTIRVCSEINKDSVKGSDNIGYALKIINDVHNQFPLPDELEPDEAVAKENDPPEKDEITTVKKDGMHLLPLGVLNSNLITQRKCDKLSNLTNTNILPNSVTSMVPEIVKNIFDPSNESTMPEKTNENISANVAKNNKDVEISTTIIDLTDDDILSATEKKSSDPLTEKRSQVNVNGAIKIGEAHKSRSDDNETDTKLHDDVTSKSKEVESLNKIKKKQLNPATSSQTSQSRLFDRVPAVGVSLNDDMLTIDITHDDIIYIKAKKKESEIIPVAENLTNVKNNTEIIVNEDDAKNNTPNILPSASEKLNSCIVTQTKEISTQIDNDEIVEIPEDNSNPQTHAKQVQETSNTNEIVCIDLSDESEEQMLPKTQCNKLKSSDTSDTKTEVKSLVTSDTKSKVKPTDISETKTEVKPSDTSNFNANVKELKTLDTKIEPNLSKMTDVLISIKTDTNLEVLQTSDNETCDLEIRNMNNTDLTENSDMINIVHDKCTQYNDLANVNPLKKEMKKECTKEEVAVLGEIENQNLTKCEIDMQIQYENLFESDSNEAYIDAEEINLQKELEKLSWDSCEKNSDSNAASLEIENECVETQETGSEIIENDVISDYMNEIDLTEEDEEESIHFVNRKLENLPWNGREKNPDSNTDALEIENQSVETQETGSEIIENDVISDYMNEINLTEEDEEESIHFVNRKLENLPWDGREKNPDSNADDFEIENQSIETQEAGSEIIENDVISDHMNEINLTEEDEEESILFVNRKLENLLRDSCEKNPDSNADALEIENQSVETQETGSEIIKNYVICDYMNESNLAEGEESISFVITEIQKPPESEIEQIVLETNENSTDPKTPETIVNELQVNNITYTNEDPNSKNVEMEDMAGDNQFDSNDNCINKGSKNINIAMVKYDKNSITKLKKNQEPEIHYVLKTNKNATEPKLPEMRVNQPQVQIITNIDKNSTTSTLDQNSILIQNNYATVNYDNIFSLPLFVDTPKETSSEPSIDICDNEMGLSILNINSIVMEKNTDITQIEDLNSKNVELKNMTGNNQFDTVENQIDKGSRNINKATVKYVKKFITKLKKSPEPEIGQIESETNENTTDPKTPETRVNESQVNNITYINKDPNLKNIEMDDMTGDNQFDAEENDVDEGSTNMNMAMVDYYKNFGTKLKKIPETDIGHYEFEINEDVTDPKTPETRVNEPQVNIVTYTNEDTNLNNVELDDMTGVMEEMRKMQQNDEGVVHSDCDDVNTPKMDDHFTCFQAEKIVSTSNKSLKHQNNFEICKTKDPNKIIIRNKGSRSAHINKIKKQKSLKKKLDKVSKKKSKSTLKKSNKISKKFEESIPENHDENIFIVKKKNKRGRPKKTQCYNCDSLETNQMQIPKNTDVKENQEKSKPMKPSKKCKPKSTYLDNSIDDLFKPEHIIYYKNPPVSKNSEDQPNSVKRKKTFSESSKLTSEQSILETNLMVCRKSEDVTCSKQRKIQESLGNEKLSERRWSKEGDIRMHSDENEKQIKTSIKKDSVESSLDYIKNKLSDFHQKYDIEAKDNVTRQVKTDDVQYSTSNTLGETSERKRRKKHNDGKLFLF